MDKWLRNAPQKVILGMQMHYNKSVLCLLSPGRGYHAAADRQSWFLLFQSDMQKVLRHARKLPDKQQQFYKVSIIVNVSLPLNLAFVFPFRNGS